MSWQQSIHLELDNKPLLLQQDNTITSASGTPAAEMIKPNSTIDLSLRSTHHSVVYYRIQPMDQTYYPLYNTSAITMTQYVAEQALSYLSLDVCEARDNGSQVIKVSSKGINTNVAVGEVTSFKFGRKTGEAFGNMKMMQAALPTTASYAPQSMTNSMYAMRGNASPVNNYSPTPQPMQYPMPQQQQQQQQQQYVPMPSYPSSTGNAPYVPLQQPQQMPTAPSAFSNVPVPMNPMSQPKMVQQLSEDLQGADVMLKQLLQTVSYGNQDMIAQRDFALQLQNLKSYVKRAECLVNILQNRK